VGEAGWAAVWHGVHHWQPRACIPCICA
jgi:hypothetical protein